MIKTVLGAFDTQNEHHKQGLVTEPAAVNQGQTSLLTDPSETQRSSGTVLLFNGCGGTAAPLTLNKGYASVRVDSQINNASSFKRKQSNTKKKLKLHIYYNNWKEYYMSLFNNQK